MKVTVNEADSVPELEWGELMQVAELAYFVPVNGTQESGVDVADPVT